MLKTLSLTTALSAALITSISQVAFSRPSSETSAYPVVANSEGLVCYMETEEGQTLNLGRLCGKVSPVNNPNLGIGISELTSSTSGLSRGSSSVSNTRYVRGIPQRIWKGE